MKLLAIVLSQTTQPQSPTQSATPSFFFLALMLALVAFMILSARSQKKRERRERDEMHARLAKNDRVLTIGGVIGTVHSIRDKEVVVKVDESTNTKMIFVKTAIQQIITDDEGVPQSKK